MGDRSVCIITPDIMGPVTCGGMGTAYFALAHVLVEAGYDATVVFAPELPFDVDELQKWTKYYGQLGIELISLPPSQVILEGSVHLRRSYSVYLWLKEKNFDVVHFPEMKGLGYYSLLARKQGLSFNRTMMCVGVHGPTLWHKEGGQESYNHWTDLELEFLERQSIKLADRVVSPSRYLFEWIKEKKWELPIDCQVIQNNLPPTLMSGKVSSIPIQEIIFFGRLETRKGLKIFCDAIDSIDNSVLAEIKITFLGKEGLVDGQRALEYISDKKKAWNFSVQILDRFNHREAINYLSTGGKLVVIPSLSDNSPCTLMECLTLQIPFIAASTGGILELINPKERESVLFDPTVDGLTLALKKAIKNPSLASMATSPTETETRWVRWHSTFISNPEESEAISNPLVSVCIPHFERPEFLKQALQSLLKQTYMKFEVIVVDDGTQNLENLAALKEIEKNELRLLSGKLIYSDHKGSSEARNQAAKFATGDYLLFMDDDNYAKSWEIETFVSVAMRTGADILTCPFDRMFLKKPPNNLSQPASRWLPLGNAAGLGLFFNVYGDMNCLIKRKKFLDLAGIRGGKSYIGEDWDFFSRASLAGMKLEVIPEALFWYREHEKNQSKTGSTYFNAAERLRPYLEEIPEILQSVLQMACNHHTYIQKENLPEGKQFSPAEPLVFLPLIEFNIQSGLEEVTPYNGITLLRKEEENLVIESQQDDPAVLLPDFSLKETDKLLFQVKLRSPADTRLQLFYRSTDTPHFDEEMSVTCDLKKGWNFKQVLVEASNLSGPFRLDPGQAPGCYYIQSVEVFALASPEQNRKRKQGKNKEKSEWLEI